MWIALFVNLSCTICSPVEVGQFQDEVACLRWVAHVVHTHPKYKGRCERLKLESQKVADGKCPPGKGWCCGPNPAGEIACRCKERC